MGKAGDEDWGAEVPVVDDDGEGAFVVDLAGFEGPLDLLLTLARSQKVDLSRISILALANQYLDFIERLRGMRLEVAADYLVMAAWLAYLKSRLMLPVEEKAEDEPSAQELAELLAKRLKRLEAIRLATELLIARPKLGVDVFARGAPEAVGVERRFVWEASLYDLLEAYGSQRQRDMVRVHHVRRRQVWALADAREILERLVGAIPDWSPIEAYLITYMTGPESRATVRASAFAASLELVREGKLEIRQSEPFAPIYLRKGSGKPDDGSEPDTASTEETP
ncbi:segregation and condensation protein A [Oryzibacter oryziterrae]|uniref:segregation and condensation protein A n=1 Tax=Oryzibacter oryziterrae TaxID=2766474 RepID=UPI001F3B4643|nr:ScpA family protein [Oryzibacter oryziterrae]